MRYLIKALIAFIIITQVSNLHLKSVEDQQYDALIQKQLSFQNKVDSIKLNIK